MLMLLAVAAPLLLIGLVADNDDDDVVTTETDGTDGDDQITGGADNDLIRGLAGDDELIGGDGDDTLLGFEGEDLLIGNNGEDMLCSGDGDDIISGNGGSDLIEGQGGNDWASGDYNSDRIMGNEGDDTLIGGRGADAVLGNEGDDVLFGGILRGVPLSEDELQDLADGTSLAEVLSGSELNIDLREDMQQDSLVGGDGDDTLFLGALDRAHGGDGADSFNVLVTEQSDDLNMAQINDFNGGQDNIAIVFDAPLDIDEVTVRSIGADAIISANGVDVAVVINGANTVLAENISILTEASVAEMFDPNAPEAVPAA